MAVIKIYLSEDGENYVSKFPNSTKEFSSICEKGHYQIPLGWSFGGTHKTNTFQCRLSGSPYYINEFEKYKHIKVTKDGNVVFLGSNPTFKKTIEKSDYYEVTATYEDYSRKFSDVLFSSDPTWEKMVLTADGWTVCNPSDTSHSLVHYLFSRLNTDSTFTLHCTHTDSTPVSYAYFKYNNKVLDAWDKCLKQNALAYYVVNRDVYVFDILEQISGTATTIPNIESEATINEKPYIDHTLPAIRRPVLIQSGETRVYDSGTITVNDGSLISGGTVYNGTMQAGAVKVGDNQEVKAMRNLTWHFSGSHSNNPKFRVQTGAPYEDTFFGIKTIITPYSDYYTGSASGSAYDETLKFILVNDNIAFDRSATVWMTANADILDYNALTKPFNEAEWNGKEEKCEFIYVSTNADIPEQNALRYLNALRYASTMEAKKYNFYSDLDLALNTVCVIQNVTTADEIAHHEYIRITDKVDNLDDFGGYTYTGVPYVSEQVVADNFFNPVTFDAGAVSKDFDFFADRTNIYVDDTGVALQSQTFTFTVRLKDYYAVPTLAVNGVAQTLVRRTIVDTSVTPNVTEYLDIWDCEYTPSGQVWGDTNGRNLVAVATLDGYSKRLDIGTTIFTPTVANITYKYAITADTTTPSSFPYDTPQNVTESTPYLWQKATTVKTDGSTFERIALIGVFIKGDAGTGVTITSTSVQYQGGSSGTTPPSGTWNDDPTVSSGSYLWTRTIVNYSDGTSTTSYAVAYQAQDGVAISSILYGVSSSSDIEPSSWSGTMPILNKGDWLWVKTTYSDSNVEYIKSYIGTDGTSGQDAKVFAINCADDIFKRDLRASGYNPSINFTLDIQGYTQGYSHSVTASGSDGTIYINADTQGTSYSLTAIPYNNSHDKITITANLIDTDNTVVKTATKVLNVSDITASPYYMGALSSAPSSGMLTGDHYTDSTTLMPYVYNGAQWVQLTANTPNFAQVIYDSAYDIWSSNNGTIPASVAQFYSFYEQIIARYVATTEIVLVNEGAKKGVIHSDGFTEATLDGLIDGSIDPTTTNQGFYGDSSGKFGAFLSYLHSVVIKKATIEDAVVQGKLDSATLYTQTEQETGDDYYNATITGGTAYWSTRKALNAITPSITSNTPVDLTTSYNGTTRYKAMYVPDNTAVEPHTLTGNQTYTTLFPTTVTATSGNVSPTGAVLAGTTINNRSDSIISDLYADSRLTAGTLTACTGTITDQSNVSTSIYKILRKTDGSRPYMVGGITDGFPAQTIPFSAEGLYVGAYNFDISGRATTWNNIGGVTVYKNEVQYAHYDINSATGCVVLGRVSVSAGDTLRMTVGSTSGQMRSMRIMICDYMETGTVDNAIAYISKPNTTNAGVYVVDANDNYINLGTSTTPYSVSLSSPFSYSATRGTSTFALDYANFSSGLNLLNTLTLASEVVIPNNDWKSVAFGASLNGTTLFNSADSGQKYYRYLGMMKNLTTPSAVVDGSFFRFDSVSVSFTRYNASNPASDTTLTLNGVTSIVFSGTAGQRTMSISYAGGSVTITDFADNDYYKAQSISFVPIARSIGNYAKDIIPYDDNTRTYTIDVGSGSNPFDNGFFKRLFLFNLPTSSTGLAIGSVWNDNGTLRIVTS